MDKNKRIPPECNGPARYEYIKARLDAGRKCLAYKMLQGEKVIVVVTGIAVGRYHTFTIKPIPEYPYPCPDTATADELRLMRGKI